MRYAPFDPEWQARAIRETNHIIGNKMTSNIKSVKITTAVTCLDHFEIDLNNFNQVDYVSNGPTEKDIKRV